MLSGDNDRLDKAISLYNSGYGEYLLLSNSDYLNVEKAINRGISRDSIILEDKATNTYTNALYTKEIMKKNNLKSAIVVTSEYHIMRSKYIFNKVYNDSDIKLTYVGSKVLVFNPKRWWETKSSRDVLIMEYLKLIRYIIIY